MCRSSGVGCFFGYFYYQYFAPNGAKTAHVFLNLARMGLAPALQSCAATIFKSFTNAAYCSARD